MHMPAGVPRSVRDALLAAPSPGSSWSPSDATEEESLRSAAFDTQEYEFGVRLPERLLMRLDRFSMSSSVEARLPYLAPELVEFAYRLPPSLKIRGRETKVVLRRALGDVIPPWVASRRKQGFDAPVEAWFGPRVRDLLGELADCDGLRSCFQAGALERVLAGRGRAAALWPVLNFALWHRFWIEGRALDDLLALA
jgi:asparagine synthase (glutamine-hydrolysing)